MRKTIIFVISVFICFSFGGCSSWYEYQTNAINCFDVGCSDILDDVFVSAYNWDGSQESINIVIPEEYNGNKITSLGGYYGRGVPCSFAVEPVESFKNSLCSDANLWGYSNILEDIGSVETKYFNFNIHISKNIEQIDIHNLNSIYIGENVDGQNHIIKIVLVFLYNITCDEQNEEFYSKDGKLYYRETDALVSDIFYYDHDFSSYIDNYTKNTSDAKEATMMQLRCR